MNGRNAIPTMTNGNSTAVQCVPVRRTVPGRNGGTLQPLPPGVSGNPQGRPKGVRYPGDYFRKLMGATNERLTTIASNPRFNEAKRAAAQAVLDMRHADPDVRGKAFDRALDRTEGKAIARVHVDQRQEMPPEQLLARIRQLAGGVLSARTPEERNEPCKSLSASAAVSGATNDPDH